MTHRSSGQNRPLLSMAIAMLGLIAIPSMTIAQMQITAIAVSQPVVKA